MPAFEDDTNVGGRIITRREVMITLAALVLVLLTLVLGRVNASVVLITSSNDSLSFPDVEASFARRVPGAGIIGSLLAVNPSKGCEPLQGMDAKQLAIPSFGLIERGNCSFVTKVQYAQEAGYSAAIVYNNEDGDDLVTMAGEGVGIDIPAVFISKQAGEILMQYVGDESARLYMLPAFENAAWSVMAVSFISVLAVSAVLSTFFFIRRHHLRRSGSRHLPHETVGLSKAEVKALATVIFSPKDKLNPENCAICLEEYTIGEKLRMLPCNHEFHMPCIDQWLTTRKAFCPICKMDAHCKIAKSPPSEHTPLLSSVTRHVGSTVASVVSSSPVVSESSTAAPVHQVPGDMC